ncbi:uncharacterized protein EKO05_0000037 [Ascochyta rabiei]|uniref:uncharacterized protein n=1 Tax=Didymella rabiei TaxID=5454 RepID=UPI002208EC19|nr:uncharacterized protein EKO05_0000037 [Ascochyta rabiei]UPX09346.1 hypothetical protein EKO05_0000037 [Ascochyta rabiei]
MITSWYLVGDNIQKKNRVHYTTLQTKPSLNLQVPTNVTAVTTDITTAPGSHAPVTRADIITRADNITPQPPTPLCHHLPTGTGTLVLALPSQPTNHQPANQRTSQSTTLPTPQIQSPQTLHFQTPTRKRTISNASTIQMPAAHPLSSVHKPCTVKVVSSTN